MSTVHHLHFGNESSPFEQGRNTHGRWRSAFQRAISSGGADAPAPWPATLRVMQDAERLSFALAEGSASAELSEHLAEYLWTSESANEDWPTNLLEWLADTERWSALPQGDTAFICGRLDRSIAGGRVYLAWLGMNGVALIDRHGDSIPLDTTLDEGERWTSELGPEPAGTNMHAFRGGLFGLERLLVYTTGAFPIGKELLDLSAADIEQALGDWAGEASTDLAFFDLRLNPVLTEPNHITVGYRWASANTCLVFWQPSPNATGYRIEEAPTPTFEEPELVAELTDGRQVQYRISPPASSPRYYRVIPLNQDILGTPSHPFSLTPITLTAPIMEPVSWTGAGGYILRWTTIPQATSYEVQMSMSADFDPHDSMVIFRGEMPELHLPGDTPPNQYYRVRAINALYAPQMPSAWSQPQRSPSQLPTPIFTKVSPRRLEWETVPGARQYQIEVGDPEDPDAHTEIVTTTQPVCIPAEQPATYRIRALRHPEDSRTASEWSDTVDMTTPAPSRSLTDARFAIPAIIVGVTVALVIGIVAGFLGLTAYQEANATATRTPIPQELLDATRDAAATAVGYATLASESSERAAESSNNYRILQSTHTAMELSNREMATALQVTLEAELTRTHIPSAMPTVTLTPSSTPNLTKTIDTAFSNGLTATAALWTETPVPSATLTPSNTPDITETIESAFAAGLTATAAGWTTTPMPTATLTPSFTPNATATFDAAFAHHLTVTASFWTATPTPDHAATEQARIEAASAATQAAAVAALPPGCYLLLPTPGNSLPVYARPDTGSNRLRAAAAPYRMLTGQQTTPDGLWLRIAFDSAGLLTGWVLLPGDLALQDAAGGPACDLIRDVAVVE